jgi:hypothetical protein
MTEPSLHLGAFHEWNNEFSNSDLDVAQITYGRQENILDQIETAMANPANESDGEVLKLDFTTQFRLALRYGAPPHDRRLLIFPWT